MLNKYLILGMIVLQLGLNACTKEGTTPGDPKRRLTDYISLSFNLKGPEDRSMLLDFLTGETKTRLEAWSDEQFKQAFLESKRQFQRLVIVETKNISSSEVGITYEVTYLDQGKGHDAKVTNKKLAILVRENDQSKWCIKDVRNIKELVEYRNEMALP